MDLPIFDVPANAESDDPQFDLFDRLWKFFVQRRGAPLLPNCREIETIITWVARDIGEETIMAGIIQAIEDHRRKTTRPGPSLTACNSEVMRLSRERLLQAMTTASRISVEAPLLDDTTLLPRLQHILEARIAHIPMPEELRKHLQSSLWRTVRDRHRKGSLASLEDLDSLLAVLDRKLGESLLNSLDDDVRLRLSGEAERALAKYRSTVRDDHFQRIVSVFMTERARVKFGVPPLSLVQVLPRDGAEF